MRASTILAAPVLLVLLCALVKISSAADGYDVRCTAAKNESVTNGNQTTVMISSDSCDQAQYLTCRNDRCGCQDPTTQIHTTREYKVKDVPPALIRTRRSPGKGGKVKSKSKGVGTGTAVAGGVIAGVAGYQLGKAVAGNDGGRGSSSFGSDRKIKILSCYSRVLGDCAIDPKKVNTFMNSTTIKDAAGNETTVTTSHQVDYLKYPPCVQHAECQPKLTRPVGSDTNIGECRCKNGYRRTAQDLCTKGGSARITSSSFVLTVAALSFLFIQLTSTKAKWL